MERERQEVKDRKRKIERGSEGEKEREIKTKRNIER